MDTYTNPQLLSQEELHEAHFEMAKNYLESKWDGHYYELVPEQYEYDGDNYEEIQEHNRSYYRKLTDEQLSRVCKLMKEAEEPLWYEALSDDTELEELINSDYGEYPMRIIEKPYQYCNCSLGVMDTTGRMGSYTISVLMPKEDYLKLLVILMDHRWATFNDLYRLDIDFFKSIADIIDHEVKSNAETLKTSYTIVFDEIERDIQSLLGEEDVVVGLCDETNDNGEDSITNIWACFSENRMAVWHDYTYPFQNDVEVIYNIDAKAVLKALNVNSYHDAAIVMKARFSGNMAYHHIQALLDSNKIEYQHAKETTELDDPLSC
jgi:hypothetical protein